jgi:hypothetical protein
METKHVQPDFPYANYPNEFPKTPVSLTPISYEEHKTLVYCLTCEDYNLSCQTETGTRNGDDDE